MTELEIGDKVRHKIDKHIIGTLVYSTFGVSVSGRNEGYHFQTLGAPVEELTQYWEKIEAKEE